MSDIVFGPGPAREGPIVPFRPVSGCGSSQLWPDMVQTGCVWSAAEGPVLTHCGQREGKGRETTPCLLGNRTPPAANFSASGAKTMPALNRPACAARLALSTVGPCGFAG